jgi:hypothetical protein
MWCYDSTLGRSSVGLIGRDRWCVSDELMTSATIAVATEIVAMISASVALVFARSAAVACRSVAAAAREAAAEASCAADAAAQAASLALRAVLGLGGLSATFFLPANPLLGQRAFGTDHPCGTEVIHQNQFSHSRLAECVELRPKLFSTPTRL